MEERKRILKMVEEGKLTVEDALVLLEQLEQAKKKGEEKANAFITALSTDVHMAGEKQEKQEKQEEQEESSSVKWSSLKTKVLDFLDVTVKKLKGLDLDFNFGTAYELKHIFQQSEASFQTIDVHIANGSVKLIPWDYHDIRIECDAKVYRVDSVEAARQLFLHDVLFSTENGHFRFAVPKQQIKVHSVIYVPQNIYDSARIRLFNGDIRTEQLRLKKIRAKTANGAIMLEQLTAEEAEFETVNGAIKLNRSIVDHLDAENINGLIDVSGQFRKIHLQSFSGNITCRTEHQESETIFIKTVTGSVKLFVPKQVGIEGELKTSVGGLSCDYPGITIIDEKNDTIQKWIRFKSNARENKRLSIYADTKTGSISLKPTGDD